MKNLLFICGKCRQRSPTAESIFSVLDNVETDAAGLSSDADILLGSDQIEWASHIVVMEKSHAIKIRRNFKKQLKDKKIICLDIPDDYDYMQIELVDLLNQRISRVI